MPAWDDPADAVSSVLCVLGVFGAARCGPPFLKGARFRVC